jgi:hypothetical protein
MKKNLIFPLIGMLLPLTFTILWLTKNTQLPLYDASTYLLGGANIFSDFKINGFWHGIESFYNLLGWRPIGYPILLVPFLLLSNGNMYFSYAAVSVMCIAISCIYIYLLLRLHLDRFSAVIGASLIGLLPFLQQQALQFFAECALFPCVFGAIYYLIKSDYLRNLNNSLAFVALFTLAFIFRPIEAATDLVLVIMAFLGLGLYKRIFASTQVLLIIAFSMTILFLLWNAAALQYLEGINVDMIGGVQVDANFKNYFIMISWIISLVAFASWISIFASLIYKSQYSRSWLLLSFAASFILIYLWFVPSAFRVYEWSYRTSVGDLGSQGDLINQTFTWKGFKDYIHLEGTVVVCGIIFLALSSLALFAIKQTKQIIFSAPFYYLILTSVIPFWEAFHTIQSTPRKLAVAYPAILLVLLLLGLKQGRLWKARIGFAIVLLALQFGLMIFLIYTPTYNYPKPIILHTIGYLIPKPISMHPSPYDVVITFLNKETTSNNIHGVGMQVDGAHGVPVDPFEMMLLVNPNNKNYVIQFPYYSKFSMDNFAKIPDVYQSIFLSDLDHRLQVSPESVAYYTDKLQSEKIESDKMRDAFLLYYAKDQLKDIGFKKGPCLTVVATDKQKYLGCLIFPIKSV